MKKESYITENNRKGDQIMANIVMPFYNKGSYRISLQC